MIPINKDNVHSLKIGDVVRETAGHDYPGCQGFGLIFWVDTEGEYNGEELSYHFLWFDDYDLKQGLYTHTYLEDREEDARHIEMGWLAIETLLQKEKDSGLLRHRGGGYTEMDLRSALSPERARYYVEPFEKATKLRQMLIMKELAKNAEYTEDYEQDQTPYLDN